MSHVDTSPFLPLSLCPFWIPFLFLVLLFFSLNTTCSLPPSPLHPPSPLSLLPVVTSVSFSPLSLLHFLPFISFPPFPLLPFLPYLLPPSPFSLLLPSLSSLPPSLFPPYTGTCIIRWRHTFPYQRPDNRPPPNPSMPLIPQTYALHNRTNSVVCQSMRS